MTASVAAAPSRSGLQRARVAVTALMFVTGAGLGVWAAHIPLLKAGLALDDATLGLVLLAMGVGAVASMPAAAMLIHRFGAAPVATCAGASFAAALAAPPFAPTALALAGAALAIGLAVGVLDISMNAQAAAVERAWRRPIMSSVHAFFSVGGLAGGAAGAGLIGAGAGAPLGMGLVAAVLISLVVGTSRWLALAGGEPSTGERPFGRPNAAVVALGALTLCSFVCEGGLMEWGAVFLRDAAGAPLAVAAGGYAAFSAAMTVGRLLGDRIVGGLGAGRAMQASGALATLALALVVVAPNPWVAYAGIALAGFGFANVVPMLFSAAGRVAGVAPAAALSMIATVGYGGQLLAPPGVGFLAHAFGLRVGFLVFVAAAAVIAVFGRRVVSPPARLPPG
ncbi:MFS transporter [Hansschlegelia plantiphila]|uniref:MFS transporter n=1 Tax=Hansschlegelia plantiphila TaxID=374655 RepID=A0A9W6MVB8_9HYPH|nr:MFS transporter [Hansschlegelia plantiphila]GLK67767.1 MFS transporter [Hansschlegelia plantiphila]